MKSITKKEIGLWAVCVVLIILVLTFVPSILLEPDRDGILTKGYIHLLYSQGIQVSALRIDVNPVLNNIYVDFWPDIHGRTSWGLVGIVLPYKGTLGDSSGWHATPLKDSTVLVKEYECTDKNPCSNLPSPEYFIFNLADKIDSKSSSHHRILFKFLYSAPTGDEYDYLLGLRQNDEQYELGFAKLENPQIIISLDKSAVNIKTDPLAEKPSSFSDKYLERIWTIGNEITYTIEYDIPSEKEGEDRITNISNYYAPLAIGVLGLILTVRFRQKGDLKQELESTQEKINHAREIGEHSYKKLLETEVSSWKTKHASLNYDPSSFHDAGFEHLKYYNNIYTPWKEAEQLLQEYNKVASDFDDSLKEHMRNEMQEKIPNFTETQGDLSDSDAKNHYSLHYLLASIMREFELRYKSIQEVTFRLELLKCSNYWVITNRGQFVMISRDENILKKQVDMLRTSMLLVYHNSAHQQQYEKLVLIRSKIENKISQFCDQLGILIQNIEVGTVLKGKCTPRGY